MAITGSDNNDTLTGTNFADTIIAAGGDDVVNAGDGADSVLGGLGNDTLSGGNGNDTLYGGDGNDSLSGGAGNDLLHGEAGNDTLAGGGGSNTVRGGAGNDVWLAGTNQTGAFGTDLVYLEDGNDLAYAGWFPSGAPDTIDFGTGNDTLSLEALDAAANQAITLYDDGTSSTTGFTSVILNVEAVIGNGGANALTGNSAANWFEGGAGNDTLSGGDGADTLLGGADNDVLSGGNGNDSLSGGAGTDTLSGDAGDDSLDGGDGADSLTGGANNDTLHGGLGDDTLQGGTGMDYADYTDATSAVSVNLATGSATGGAGTDVLGGVDGLFGSRFADTLIGFDGQGADATDGYTNVFYGNAGNDLLNGAGGDDSLYGGADNDTVLGGTGNDLVDGGSGNDSLDAGAGNDLVLGGTGNDFILAQAGDDTIDGGTGNDTISVSSNGTTVIVGSEDGDNGDVDTLYVFRHNIDWSRTTITGESGTIWWLNGTSTTFDNIENVEFVRNVPCFTPGTLIETKRGRVPVEALRLGDRVLTRDNGYQPVRWIGRRKLSAADLAARPQLQPIRIAQGALGDGLPEVDMLVSPQHRMLISNTRSELLFGEAEVLAAAVHMIGRPGIARVTLREVTYLHLMFDAHEIIRADGAWTESFQPGDMALTGLEAPQREELFEIFPDLRKSQRSGRWSSARLSLKAHEVRVLLRAA